VSRQRSNRLRFALGLVGLVGLLFAFVFPTRTWLDQQSQTRNVENQIELLRSETEQLADERARLESDAEIERIARERFNLVKPGETAWVIVPPPTTAPSADAPAEPDDGGGP